MPDMGKLGARSFAAMVLTLNPRLERYDVMEALRPIVSNMEELFWAFADDRHAVLLGFWENNEELVAVEGLLRTSGAISDVEIQAFPLETSNFDRFMDFSGVLDDVLGKPDMNNSLENRGSRSYKKTKSSPRAGRRTNLTDREMAILLGLIENPELYDDALAEKIGLAEIAVVYAHKKINAKRLFKTVLVPDPRRFGNIVALWTTHGASEDRPVQGTTCAQNDIEACRSEIPSAAPSTGYISTAALFGLDKSSTPLPAEIPGAGPPAESGSYSGEPRPMHLAIALPLANPALAQDASPTQIGRPGRPQKTSSADGTSIDIPTALSLDSETASDPENEPPGSEIPDSRIPGMDYTPEITPDSIRDETTGDSAAGGQPTTDEANATARPQISQETRPPKDRFSLGDLEATLAMSIRPRAAGTVKPFPQSRIERSGTFVWDVEKLGAPRRIRADRHDTTPHNSGDPSPPRAPIIMAPLKRGRGRPRNNPLIGVPKIPVKRPRGRPPKIRIDTPETTPLKRKRGRPRKNPVIQAPEVPIKRRRGRPPKIKVDPTQTPPVKRKRGRPRKNPVIQAPKIAVKRRRGRPPKNPRSSNSAPTGAIPMTMERFVNNIPITTAPLSMQTNLPIVLDVTNGKNRFVLGLFQDRHTARRAVHHLKNGVFLDGRRMKQFGTRGLAILKEIDFGSAVRKILGRQH